MTARNYGEFTVAGEVHDAQEMCWWFRRERLQRDWKDVSEIANFIADYLSVKFPDRDVGEVRQLRDSASFVVNELVENAVKYCTDSVIQASGGTDGETWIFAISHGSAPESVVGLEDFLTRLQASSAEELMIEQVERNFELGSDSGSGLGLISIIADHGAVMAWKIVPTDGGQCRVYTVARLAMEGT